MESKWVLVVWLFHILEPVRVSPDLVCRRRTSLGKMQNLELLFEIAIQNCGNRCRQYVEVGWMGEIRISAEITSDS